MTEPRTVLAAVLPDRPRWIDARGTLLSRPCDIVAGSVTDFVVVARAGSYASVVGSPPEHVLREALRRGAGGAPAVLVQPEARDAVSGWLPDWSCERVLVHQRSPKPRDAPQACEDGPRPLARADLERRANLPDALREELSEALDYTPVLACFVDGRPVSFCYSGVETESLWDVSVDTLAAYRGAGLAGRCFEAAAALQRDRGRRAVWCAVASNDASRRAAKKRGFRELPEETFFELSPPGDDR